MEPLPLIPYPACANPDNRCVVGVRACFETTRETMRLPAATIPAVHSLSHPQN